MGRRGWAALRAGVVVLGPLEVAVRHCFPIRDTVMTVGAATAAAL
jgi:hypothetical protein